MRRRLRLYYHRGSHGSTNFGDELSPIILRYVTGRDVAFAPLGTCDVIGLGSLLGKLFRWQYRSIVFSPLNLMRRSKPIIWGSGFIREHSSASPDHLDVRAVRGTKSREIIGRPHVALGDPGVLIYEVFQERRKKYRVGFVPHINDLGSEEAKAFHSRIPDMRMISVCDPPMQVLREISQCEFIFSSSLHGLIVADAFQIPNWWVRFGDRVAGGDFKFLDYGSSVGRTSMRPIELSELQPLKRAENADWSYQANLAACGVQLKNTISDLTT